MRPTALAAARRVHPCPRGIIDASWTIEATRSVGGSADEDVAWLTAAAALNGETIDTARVDNDDSLRLTTDSGIAVGVSGEPELYTVGETWWLTGWHPV